MRIPAVKTLSAVLALAVVAVLGATYASATPLGGTSNAKPSLSGTTSAQTSAVSLRVVPDAAPLRNIAHSYTTASSGGTGQVSFTIPSLANGVYEASFTANFFPAGSPSAPATFSCYLVTNTALIAQDTSSTTYTSGFYAGVNGAAFVKNPSANGLFAGCGTADGSAWTWGSRPLVVTLTRMDGLTNGSLSPSNQKGAGAALAGH